MLGEIGENGEGEDFLVLIMNSKCATK
jgi:hypothetical protein